jgi:hypothetical protein
MMDFGTWKNIIMDFAIQVSDREYQRLSWFGKGPEVSSPDELYNGLFDDGMINEFLEKYAHDLTPEQCDAGKKLVRQMNHYAAVSPKSLNPTDVIDDPRWEEIRQSALLFVGAMRRLK